jgi:FdrA protein
MVTKTLIKPNSYYDSLVLMRISTQMMQLPGVTDAALLMATEQNKLSIGNPALLSDEVQAAGPDDLFVVVLAQTEEQAQAALDFAVDTLTADRSTGIGRVVAAMHTLDSALRGRPDANLAILSVPGRYVRREALKALDAGLNLLIFSDNVPLAHEIELKRMAQERGLLVMGPDCGTAIIAGAALGFANAVRRGSIGLVGASGTGLQEVSCLIHRLEQGVSHAIGTGTHDVDAEVGGITMLEGIRRLEGDPGTRVIVIVSKPPAPSVIRSVMKVVETCQKPVVVNFLDGDAEAVAAAGGIVAHSLEDAAVKAVAASTSEKENAIRERLLPGARKARAGLSETQQYVRGLFSGGTFANEAAMLMRDWIGNVHTNGKVKGTSTLSDPRKSVGHTCEQILRRR